MVRSRHAGVRARNLGPATFVVCADLRAARRRLLLSRPTDPIPSPYYFRVRPGHLDGVVEGGPFRGDHDGSSRGAIDAFKAELDGAGVPATVRLTRGRDIGMRPRLATAPRLRPGVMTELAEGFDEVGNGGASITPASRLRETRGLRREGVYANPVAIDTTYIAP